MSPKPAKSVHTWSLFRTMGRFVAPGSMPLNRSLTEGGGGGLDLLELPAALADHGFATAQLCHFYLPRLDDSYVDELRAAFAEAGVELEAFLIDDGDPAHPTEADAQVDWISGWVTIAERLGATRTRVCAGQQLPSPTTLAASAAGLVRLADRHGDTRIVTENWLALLPDAASVNGLLDRTEGRVGFLIDLGNWKGPGKYAELAAVAPRAETCQAKVTTNAAGEIDADDFRACLTVLNEANYTGPLALVHDGPDNDEWGKLDEAYALVSSAGQSE
ncbi:sugar phosphate isomerase/epimerase family protein [Aestuariimicrobium soli]|uniref:sugar phosphate isomerase/epimerase family protein n=1 Tax=Aestuariimicrobium soli TaxID=2035834 RepID=UPI003EBBF231